MQNINVDIAQTGVAETLFFKQGDVNRYFQVTVTDNGTPYPVEDAEQVSVWYSGSSGQGIYTDAGEESACTVEGNVITVKVLAPLVIKKGAGTLCLMLSHPDGTQLGLWNIVYHVEGVPGYESPEAMNYYNALGRMIAETRKVADEIREAAETVQTDSTLSVAGMPADAYEVGDRFDQVFSWMSTDVTLTVSDVPADSYTVGEALDKKLTAENDRYNYGTYRVGVFMEWLNPGMDLSVEYATIYRYMGYTVYMMLVDCGSLPNTGVKNMPTSITPGCKVISYEFRVYNEDETSVYINPSKIDGKELTLMTYNDNTCINASITTQGDLSLYSARCLIKYTKKEF